MISSLLKNKMIYANYPHSNNPTAMERIQKFEDSRRLFHAQAEEDMWLFHRLTRGTVYKQTLDDIEAHRYLSNPHKYY